MGIQINHQVKRLTYNHHASFLFSTELSAQEITSISKKNYRHISQLTFQGRYMGRAHIFQQCQRHCKMVEFLFINCHFRTSLHDFVYPFENNGANLERILQYSFNKHINPPYGDEIVKMRTVSSGSFPHSIFSIVSSSTVQLSF